MLGIYFIYVASQTQAFDYIGEELHESDHLLLVATYRFGTCGPPA
jgi:hypothetical protein